MTISAHHEISSFLNSSRRIISRTPSYRCAKGQHARFHGKFEDVGRGEVRQVRLLVRVGGWDREVADEVEEAADRRHHRGVLEHDAL